MDIRFFFSTGIIRNLGPSEFELLINNRVMQLFTLPNPRTCIHNLNNWIFDLEPQPTSPLVSLEITKIYDHNDVFLSDTEIDLEIPPFYHHFAPIDKPTPSCPSLAPVASAPLSGDHETALLAVQTESNCLREEFTKLRVEFHGFMDLVTEQVEHIL